MQKKVKDAERDLLDIVVQYLRHHAEENSLELKRLVDSVDDVTQIINSYKKLVTWLCSAATVDHDGTIRIEDAKLTSAQMQELGLHDGMYHRTTHSIREALGSALDAAFTIGGQRGLRKARANKGKKRSPAKIDKLVELYEMHYFQGMSGPEIAQAKGIEKEAAKKQLQRMKKMVADLIKGMTDEERKQLVEDIERSNKDGTL